MNKRVVVTRGALSLAALLLLSHPPAFAKSDAIEFDREVETGKYRVTTDDSTEVIDDSNRGFWISINRNDDTFEMVQDGRN